jgi:hypothetical protein
MLTVPLNEEAVNRILLRETLRHVEPEELYVIGGDGVQIWRDSRTMEGTSWLKCPRTPVWRPGIHRAQRFLNGSWLVPPEQGYSRAVVLRFLSAFVEKAQRACHDGMKEWQAALTFIAWVRAQLDEAGRVAQSVLFLGDGSFDTIGLWTALPERVVMLARTATNRCLYNLPGAYCGRGAHRWSFNYLWRALHVDCLNAPGFLPLLSLFPANLAKNRPLAAMLHDAMLAAAPA